MSVFLDNGMTLTASPQEPLPGIVAVQIRNLFALRISLTWLSGLAGLTVVRAGDSLVFAEASSGLMVRRHIS